MNKRSTLFLITILLLCGATRAQNGSVSKQMNNNQCFSVEELEELMHISYFDADDILYSKGYQIGSSSEKTSGEYHDTIDGIVLTYSRRAFYDINDLKSSLRLYTSEDGLSNIVEWVRYDADNCALPPQFSERSYIYNPSKKSFHGSGEYHENLVHYDVKYQQDSVLHLIMKDQQEIDTFVTKRKEAREASLIAKAESARYYAVQDQYLTALAVLDSLEGNGPRVDNAINATRSYVIDQAEGFYFSKLNVLVNNNSVNEAIKCCDTLLIFTHAQDSISEIRTLLQQQLNGETNHYSEFHPEEYKEIVKRLEKIVNDELSQNVLQEEQRMRMDFTILTKKENESSGKISVGLSSAGLRSGAGSVGVIGNRLQRSIDELAQSDLIQPVRQHGVYITTRDLLSADIRWKYYIVKVEDECDTSNQQLASAVKFIDDHFFTDHDTIRTSSIQKNSELTVTGRVRKPTKRNYTFTVNEKRMGETTYTDIALSKFSTTGLLTWTPSLIIPGIGTKNLGLYSSASARAIPFFLCTALSIAGFVWENNGGKTVDRPTFEEGGATYPWHYKDVGYYVGYGAAAIAGTIYLNELVEGISGSFRNLHRSKALRKRLKKGPVTVQTENIRLQ